MDSELTSRESELMRQAKRRVSLKMGFYVHLLVFVLVNLGLFAVNSYTGGYRWSTFPLWGWGLGLTIHGVVTLLSLQGDGMRERMLKSEMDALRKRQP